MGIFQPASGADIVELEGIFNIERSAWRSCRRTLGASIASEKRRRSMRHLDCHYLAWRRASVAFSAKRAA